MSESRQGQVSQTWKRGDPPPGYYFLNLQCGFCGAKNGYIYPEAGAPLIGSEFVAAKGQQVGVCQRCGKSNRCIVMSQPKYVLPPQPTAWSW